VIVDSFLGPVGEWWAQEPVADSALRHLLERGRTAAEILDRHRLMRCAEVRLTLPSGVTVPGAEGDELRLASDAAHLLEVVSQSGVAPHVIALRGPGVTFTENGDEIESLDVVWIELMTRDVHLCGIKTQSDAWLSHTLDAKPQPGVHARNAKRLTQALEEIQRAWTIPLVGEEHTRFADCSGFELRNQTYANGEVVDCSVLLKS